MHTARLHRRLLVAVITGIVISASALAQDVTITAPGGGGFVVTDAASSALFAIDANGHLSIAHLGTASAQSTPMCFDAVSGAVGSCADGGPIGPEGPIGATGVAGPVGPAGAIGPAGSIGPIGPVGASGLTGPAGATGATGPAGVAGPSGADGSPGLDGPPGADGSPGLDGPPGPPGATGATGPAGSSRQILTASTASATPLILAGGLPGPVAVLPLSGYMETAYVVAPVGTGGPIDLSMAPPPQVLAANGSITGLSAVINTKVLLSLVDTTVAVEAQLYINTSGGTLMTPVAGAACTLAPAFTGAVPAGTRATCTTSGLAIPYTQGTTAVIVLSAHTAAGSGPVAVSATVGLSLN